MSARGQEIRPRKKWQASSSMAKAQATAPAHTNMSGSKVGNTPQQDCVHSAIRMERERNRKTGRLHWYLANARVSPIARHLEACWFISKHLGCCFPTHCGKRPKTCMRPAQLLSPDTCHKQVPGETGGWILAVHTQGVSVQGNRK